MTDSSPLRALTCPNCGAPLEFPKAQASVRCRFCDSIIERSDEAPTADDLGHALNVEVLGGQVHVSRAANANSRRFIIKMRNGQPLVIEAGDPVPLPPPPVITSSGPSGSAGPRRAGGGACGVYLVVAVLAAGGLFIGLAGMLGGAGLGAVGDFLNSGDLRVFQTQVPGLSEVMTQVPGFDDLLTQVPSVGNRDTVSSSAVLVPAVSDAPADVIALTTEYSLSSGDNLQHLVALSGAEAELLWRSAPLDKDTYSAPILADSDFVYTVTGTRLLALRRADGQIAWNVTLADQLSLNICPGCFRLAGERLFTLTEDGTLQAYDARTGEPLWDYQALQDSPRGLYLLAGQPAFMDRDDQNNGLLRVFDPATGEPRTVQPTCATDFSSPDYPDWTTPLYLDPDGANLYIVFGFFRTCVTRLNAETLEAAWSTRLPEDLERLDTNVPPAFAADALYFSAGERVIQLSAADGAVAVTLEDPDYTFVPLTTAGDLLIARAKRQRGSARYELWAIDRAGGQTRWTYNLNQDPPLEVNSSIIDEDQPVWTWHVTAEGLTILRFKRAVDDVSHAVSIDTVNLETGVSAGEQDVRLGVETILLSAPTLLGWQQGTLWFVIEGQVLALDTARGAIVYRWP